MEQGPIPAGWQHEQLRKSRGRAGCGANVSDFVESVQPAGPKLQLQAERPTYAPTLFAKEKSARKAGIKKANFEEAMRSFFAADKIWLEPYGSPCRETSRLAVKK